MEKLKEIRVLREKESSEGNVLPQGIQPSVGEYLYKFILEKKIRTVVETGIYHGFSAYYFLLALEQTNGVLYSIEANLKPPDQIVVPIEKRKIWKIIEGKSPDLLATLFEIIEAADLFVHDSRHSFDVMFSEYMIASKHCRFVASHDIYKNAAWNIFLKHSQSRLIYQDQFFGLAEVI